MNSHPDIAPCVWALVPAKSPRRAKSRLARVLTPERRALLQRAMLSDVLAVLSRTECIAGTAVVTPDGTLAAVVRMAGARMIHEDVASGDLNTSIAAGVAALRELGADFIAVVPADLPFLDPGDIERAVLLSCGQGRTVVVPDRHRSGTNGLVFPAEAAPEPAFGRDSLRRHLSGAEGREPIALVLPSMAFDIDTPADLVEFAASPHAGAPQTRAALGAIATGPLARRENS